MSDLGSLPGWGEIAGGVALIASGITALAHFLAIHTAREEAIRIRAKVDARAAEVDAAVVANTARVEKLAAELAAHRLMVAEKYVAVEMLEKVEARFLSAIDGVSLAIRDLASRFDRAYERRDH